MIRSLIPLLLLVSVAQGSYQYGSVKITEERKAGTVVGSGTIIGIKAVGEREVDKYVLTASHVIATSAPTIHETVKSNASEKKPYPTRPGVVLARDKTSDLVLIKFRSQGVMLHPVMPLEWEYARRGDIRVFEESDALGYTVFEIIDWDIEPDGHSKKKFAPGWSGGGFIGKVGPKGTISKKGYSIQGGFGYLVGVITQFHQITTVAEIHSFLRSSGHGWLLDSPIDLTGYTTDRPERLSINVIIRSRPTLKEALWSHRNQEE